MEVKNSPKVNNHEHYSSKFNRRCNFRLYNKTHDGLDKSFIKVFRTVEPHGNADYGATNRLDITAVDRKVYADRARLIEGYHRSIEQFTGIQAGQFPLEISQRNHIGLAVRAFARLEFHRWKHRLPIFDANLNIIRQALRLYLAHPTLVLPSTA